MGLLFGVTWQCCICQAAIRDFQVVSHYLSSMCFHSVVQIIKLDHFIFIPLVASFEQSGGSDHMLLVFWNMGKGEGIIRICVCSPLPKKKKLYPDALAIMNPLNYAHHSY